MLGEMTDDVDPRAALVDKLVDQSFRVSRIVSNLHAAVRGIREERIVLELGQVVARAAQDAARSLGAIDRLELGGIVEQVFVHGAQGPVELAVSNLVRNALEASPPETKVFVEVVAESDMALVRVRDAGPGVPDEVADRVFEPFFTTKDKRGGTGLGLSMTRDMIAQLGGEVDLENAPEGGALATIKLQRCRESEAS
jgi:signal transduction histidine kinase